MPDFRDLSGFLLQRTDQTPAGHKHTSKLQIDPADVVALGALLVAIIIAVAFTIGKVSGKSAVEIILGCVGTGGASEILKLWLHKRKVI